MKMRPHVFGVRRSYPLYLSNFGHRRRFQIGKLAELLHESLRLCWADARNILKG